MINTKTKIIAILGILLVMILPVLFNCANEPVQAPKESTTVKTVKITEYVLPAILDQSGPLSPLAPQLSEPRKVAIGWWNENKGKKLGVKLNYKEYDSRFDPSVVASLWPQILTNDKPVVVMGNAGDSVFGIGGRVADDKIPVVQFSCALSSNWKPGQWMFFPRPMSNQSLGAFLYWAKANLIKDRPIRLGILAAEVPSGVDLANAAQAYCDKVLKPEGTAEIADIQYVAMTAVDITPQLQKLSAATPDFIWVGPSSTPVAAIVAKYMAGVDKPIPLLLSQLHNNSILLQLVGPKMAEGNYDICEYAPTNIDSPAIKVFNENKGTYGTKNITFNDYAMQSMGQCIVVLNAVERAAAAVGADKLSGQAIYDALTSGIAFSNEDVWGAYQFVKFTKDTTINFAGIQITTVKDGNRITVSKNWVDLPTNVPK